MGGDATAADGPNVDAPDSLPAITSLLRDDEGQLWVQHMGSAAEVDPSAVNSAAACTAWLGGQVWDVLSAEETIVARAMLPQSLRPLRNANGRVYGVVADSIGVQRVVRLRITRAGGPT